MSYARMVAAANVGPAAEASIFPFFRCLFQIAIRDAD
jgi:hypothetical protein